MKGDKEIVGTLRGFDVYVNMVLENVTEIDMTPEVSGVGRHANKKLSDARANITPSQGRKITKLDQILLNGNNIALIIPGGAPDFMK